MWSSLDSFASAKFDLILNRELNKSCLVLWPFRIIQLMHLLVGGIQLFQHNDNNLSIKQIDRLLSLLRQPSVVTCRHNCSRRCMLLFEYDYIWLVCGVLYETILSDRDLCYRNSRSSKRLIRRSMYFWNTTTIDNIQSQALHEI